MAFIFYTNQLLISLLLLVGLNQAFEPRCRTWPSNQNGTITTEDGAFYIRCEYKGTFSDGHECQFRHYANSDIYAPISMAKIYTSNAIGDVIGLLFGDMLYNFYITKEEMILSIPLSMPQIIRTCNIKAMPNPKSGKDFPQDFEKDNISLDIIAGYNDKLVSTR